MLRELHEIVNDNPFPYLTVAPRLIDERYVHFVLQGTVDTPWQGGVYTGKLYVPPNYPFRPPSVYVMMTPTGKSQFLPGVNVCALSGTWNPSTKGLRDFFALVVSRWQSNGPAAVRVRWLFPIQPDSVEKLAATSFESSVQLCPYFETLFPQHRPGEFHDGGTGATTAASGLDNDDESYALPNADDDLKALDKKKQQ